MINVVVSKPQVTLGQVLKVYSGQAAGCRCGCHGVYRANPAHLAQANAERGFDYAGREVGGPLLAKAVGLLNRAQPAECEWDPAGEWAEVLVGRRAYCVYFAQPVLAELAQVDDQAQPAGPQPE